MCNPLVADARHDQAARTTRRAQLPHRSPFPRHTSRSCQHTSPPSVQHPSSPPSTMPHSRLALGFHTNTRHGVDSNPSLEPAEPAGRSGSWRVVYLGSAFAWAAASSRNSLGARTHLSALATELAHTLLPPLVTHLWGEERGRRKGRAARIQGKRGAGTVAAGRQASAHSTGRRRGGARVRTLVVVKWAEEREGTSRRCNEHSTKLGYSRGAERCGTLKCIIRAPGCRVGGGRVAFRHGPQAPHSQALTRA